MIALVLAAVLGSLPACGEWSTGDGERTAVPRDEARDPVEAARYDAPPSRAERVPVDTVLRPVPARARPDTIGVLVERELDVEVEGVDVDEYLLWLPPGLERGEGKWPLLLWLHGRSLRGDDTDRLKRYGPPAILARGGALPFVVVAPQLPEDGGWYDLDPVVALVDEIVARYPVDPDRVYLLGFSMGGGGAWRMAFDHGDRFAAMIAIAAHTPAPTPERVLAVSRLPFLAIHGTEDRRVPLAPARTMADALAAIGAAAFEFRMVPGADHSRLERLTRDDELYAWLLGHRRTVRSAALPAR